VAVILLRRRSADSIRAEEACPPHQGRIYASSRTPLGRDVTQPLQRGWVHICSP
jgi:hypothetical protein